MQVVRERRPRERPARDRRCRTRGCDEYKAALDALTREQEPEHEDPYAHEEPCTRQRERECERRDVDEQRARDPDPAPQRCSRPEPEPEHDADVREERERVPVIDGLVQPPDPLVLDERGNGLRGQRPGESRPDDEREHVAGEPRGAPASDGSEHDAEPEEGDVGDALVEDIPAAVGDDRPPDGRAHPGDEQHERAHEDGTRAADARRRQPPERDPDERRRQQHDGRSPDREDPADVRAVTGEGRAEERAPHERCEHESA